MSRYQLCFEALAQKQQGAFVPFVTLGDPDAELSLKIIDALIEGGADALEIGIPFLIHWLMALLFKGQTYGH